MTARDVFAGCSVTIMMVGHRWAVGLVDENASSLALTVYDSVEAALQASRRWFELIDEESQLSLEEAVKGSHSPAVLREQVVARAGAPQNADQTLQQTFEERVKIRTWFTRQLEPEDSSSSTE